MQSNKFANCNACPLQGKPMVYGHGCETSPDIAFVGEAPGETEVEKGIPLIGKSGQFLRMILKDIGIDENKCYFTNVCLCRPDENATPNAAMAKACEARLSNELAAVQPKIIVALGKVAASYIGGHKKAMARIHGYYSEVTLDSPDNNWSAGCVPTFHPAGVLRTPDDFRDLVEDLEYAKSIVEGQPAVIEPPYENYKFVDKQEDFDKFVEELKTKPLVSVDLETDKIDPFEARVLCAGFSWEREHATVVDWVLIEHNRENLAKLNDALENVQLALQNGIFDAPVFYVNGFTHVNYYLDTMIEHYLLDERQGTHGLERLAIKYYRAPAYKTAFRNSLDLPRGFASDEVFSQAILASSRDNLFRYNGADADYTFRLAVDLVEKVKQAGLLTVLKDIEMPSARVFVEFFMTGLLVDRDYLEKLGTEWVREENELLIQMKEQVGDPDFNPGSNKQLGAYMYDTLKLVPFGGESSFKKELIDEGVISKFILTVDDPEAREYWTSRKVGKLKSKSTEAYMLYWLKQQHEFPGLVLKWRHIRKRKSMYYDGLKEHMYKDSRVRPAYDIVSTRTGRKITRDPAIHNIPRGDEIYNIFVAEPGWCLIHADYAQAELRMMCHYSGDKVLAHLLETTDIHTRMVMELFNLSPEDIEAMSRDELLNKRIAAKTITFGLPYGRKGASLAPQLGVTKKEAQDYIDTYFKMFPDLQKWIEKVRIEGVKNQVVVNMFGRTRRFPLIVDKFQQGEVMRQAGNMPIQSGINDLTLLAYVNSLKALRRNNIPVKPGAHIHDSINYTVPKPLWKIAVEIIMKEMDTVPFESPITFPGTCEVGERWGSMYKIYDRGKWEDPTSSKDLPPWIVRGLEIAWEQTHLERSENELTA